MATVRSGNKSALLIVDVQVGVMQNAWKAQQVIANIARVVERARASATPIIWVQQSDEELISGSPDWEWVPQLKPLQDETRIEKYFNSAFENTILEDQLAAMGISRIVLAGAASNWCIRSTAFGALERGYDLNLVQDAHTTETLDLENGTEIDAQTMVTDLNIAITWLSYPGRENTTAGAEDVRFD